MNKQEIVVGVIFLALIVGAVSLAVNLIGPVSIEGLGEEIQAIEQKFNKGYNK